MNILRLPPLVAALALIPPVRAHETGEALIVVGRDVAGNLKVETDYEQPLELDASVFAGVYGYATGSLGMHSTVLDEPDEDFFQVSPAADFRFILLAKAPGMEVLSYGALTYMNIGDSYYIGPAPFDTHPLWNLVTGLEGAAYSLTLKLHDVNGIYPDSEPFTLTFTPEPGPRHLLLDQSDPLHTTLVWPTNAVNWSLESSRDLNETSWVAVTKPPVINGTNFSLTLTNSEEPQFFRLHLP